MLSVNCQNQWAHHQPLTFCELFYVQESHYVRWQWNYSPCSPTSDLRKDQLAPETKERRNDGQTHGFQSQPILFVKVKPE